MIILYNLNFKLSFDLDIVLFSSWPIGPWILIFMTNIENLRNFLEKSYSRRLDSRSLTLIYSHLISNSFYNF